MNISVCHVHTYLPTSRDKNLYAPSLKFLQRKNKKPHTLSFNFSYVVLLLYKVQTLYVIVNMSINGFKLMFCYSFLRALEADGQHVWLPTKRHDQVMGSILHQAGIEKIKLMGSWVGPVQNGYQEICPGKVKAEPNIDDIIHQVPICL